MNVTFSLTYPTRFGVSWPSSKNHVSRNRCRRLRATGLCRRGGSRTRCFTAEGHPFSSFDDASGSLNCSELRVAHALLTILVTRGAAWGHDGSLCHLTKSESRPYSTPTVVSTNRPHTATSLKSAAVCNLARLSQSSCMNYVPIIV